MGIPLQNIPPLVKASTTSCTLASTYEGTQSILRIGGKYYRFTNTLPTGITSITVTQPSTHVIRVSIASTAPSAEGRVLFTGSIA